MTMTGKCELCGYQMPPGEEVFRYHGYSSDCPGPPLPAAQPAGVRAAFEKWWLTEGAGKFLTGSDADKLAFAEEYSSIGCEWQAWQAAHASSTAATCEWAAKVCDRYLEQGDWDKDTCIAIAATIRDIGQALSAGR